ncbi:MAG: PQQ-binding-like beta-propeller repeat protein [Candidatus Devosia euplotis]|nr:PQQ-binding-like beta-propeller repeat protein [Candidatus Devosia euplotis]
MTKPEFARRGRTLQPGQTAELTISNADGTGRTVIFTTDEIIETSNWTPDGQTPIFNAGSELWRVPTSGGTPRRIDTGERRDLNKDHVLSPDGQTVYVSADNGHLYAVPVTGGTPHRASNTHATPHHYYLHGISPDGLTLAYVAVEAPHGTRRINIFTIPAADGPDTRLTDLDAPHDGPEYTPDGSWIYFNSERASPGHAQSFRMRTDGTGVEQLTDDERVNWSPISRRTARPWSISATRRAPRVTLPTRM